MDSWYKLVRIHFYRGNDHTQQQEDIATHRRLILLLPVHRLNIQLTILNLLALLAIVLALKHHLVRHHCAVIPSLLSKQQLQQWQPHQ